jgi:Kef-type K+ transport system membrane component KefB/mannitol/fructose-specific phosphotransferase system IIA component
MENLSSHQIMIFLLSLGILLGTARVLGEIAQRFRQPAVLGELLAGILLGPTVLGHVSPNLFAALFPRQGANAIALDTISNVAIVLFLMVAGIEVDLSTVWRQGKLGLKVGVSSIVIPFAMGFALALNAPGIFGGVHADPLVFSLFIAIALSISALPVIAKTLMDMDLYRSDLGMVVVSAAIFNDLVGWVLFAVVLGLMENFSGGGHSIMITLVSILGFAGFMLTLGRILIHKALPFVQAYTRWPGGELSFAVILAIFGAAFTEWIGIHAIFGAFLVGAAVGDSAHLRERTRFTIAHFVSFIFAPVFFAGIGLKVDFLAHFNPGLISVVLAVACVCKLAGGTLGARWGGMPRHEAWAVGFAMNSRGAMEIILGLLALQAGIIRQELFVALIVMAIVTSMISGPFMKMILKPEKVWRLQEALPSKLFLRELKAGTRREAIEELTEAACTQSGLPWETVKSAVWAREEAMSTCIGNGVALPHARIEGIRDAMVVMGVSDAGIDFDAPDDRLAHVLFLILTPAHDPGVQLTIASELARLFRKPHMLDRILRSRSYTDFMAILRASAPVDPMV